MSLPLSKIGPNVKESFLRLGDSMEIFPLYGRKRTVVLNRTKVRFIVKKRGDIGFSPLEITLPSVEDEESVYEINLTEQDNYTITLVSGFAFKLNGQYSSCSYLCKGDELIFGHNQINFKKTQAPVPEVGIILSDLNILIEGETGVGKSSLAKKIHEANERRGQFVHLNLSSFPLSLIESELFGHCKGAFTGAIKDKIGAIEHAKYGTLFLDEIDSLPLELQVKLLLFLDNRTIRPVGSVREVSCETALIFAAGSSLERLVEAGKMRKDLFFRISCGHRIRIPALRDSREVIKSICESFELENDIRITARLLGFLMVQNWPGNIRQLIGHLQKKVVLSKTRVLDINEVEDELLQYEITPTNEGIILPFKEVKESYFKRAFYLSDQNIQLTAKRMKVSDNTVRNIVLKNINQLK